MAPSPITAAAMPRPTSNPLTLRAPAEAGGRGAPAGAPAGRPAGAPVFVAGRLAAAGAAAAPATARLGAPAVGGRGGGGAAPAGAAAAGAEEAPGAAGPPAGRVGSLIVGDEVGLGGRLIRTVSFFGWIFAASGGFGGTESPGVVGLFSDIVLARWCQARIGESECQTFTRRVRVLERSVCARCEWRGSFGRSSHHGLQSGAKLVSGHATAIDAAGGDAAHECR